MANFNPNKYCKGEEHSARKSLKWGTDLEQKFSEAFPVELPPEPRSEAWAADKVKEEKSTFSKRTSLLS